MLLAKIADMSLYPVETFTFFIGCMAMLSIFGILFCIRGSVDKK